MDDILAPLVEKGEDPPLDLSPAGLEQNRQDLALMGAHPDLVELYTLWRQLSGMGGESLADLWDLGSRPGTWVAFRVFGACQRRLKRIEKGREIFQRKGQ